MFHRGDAALQAACGGCKSRFLHSPRWAEVFEILNFKSGESVGFSEGFHTPFHTGSIPVPAITGVRRSERAELVCKTGAERLSGCKSLDTYQF